MKIVMVFLGTLVGVAPASVASSDPNYKEWLNQCTPGAFQACISISLGFGYDPTSEVSTLTMRVSNLQGWKGLPNTGLWGIREINITNLQGIDPSFGPSNPRYGFSGGTSVEGNAVPVQGWEGYARETDAVNHLWTFRTQTLNGGWYEFGCDYPVGPFDGWDQPVGGTRGYTCDGGSLVATMQYLTGRWSVTDQTEIFFEGPKADLIRVGCTTGLDCITVTPEPVSIVLLGTGLAAMGAAVRKRRKERLLSD